MSSHNTIDTANGSEALNALIAPEDYAETVLRVARGESTAAREIDEAIESAAHAGISVTDAAREAAIGGLELDADERRGE